MSEKEFLAIKYTENWS